MGGNTEQVPILAPEGERPPSDVAETSKAGGACSGAACPPSSGAAFLAVVGTSTDDVEGDSEAMLDTGLLAARLRVFVLDADELPEIADLYSVQAFPTIVAWGLPGAAPLMAQGYLDDSAFDQLLRAAAESGPGNTADSADMGVADGGPL